MRFFAVIVAAGLLAWTPPLSAQDARPPIEATTPAGDKVLLYPNGRWEYVDPKKAEGARAVAQQYPENQGCPRGTQGGVFGIGRCIQPGDKDYNRGTLNPGRR